MKKNISERKLRELEVAWRKHNRWLRQHHMQPESFDDYVESVLGQKKIDRQKFTELKTAPTYHRGRTDHIPSKDTGSHTATRSEPRVYDGERRLLGIATMHKSNMVPVFDQESATDIAKMRRN